MLSLGRFLQHAAGEDEVDQGALVERLVQRAAEAVLLPDRRAALQELRDLLATGDARAQAAFGAAGLPVALGVVRDREDLESVQLALEALAAAVGGGEHGGGVTQVGCCSARGPGLLAGSAATGCWRRDCAPWRRSLIAPSTRPPARPPFRPPSAGHRRERAAAGAHARRPAAAAELAGGGAGGHGRLLRAVPRAASAQGPVRGGAPAAAGGAGAGCAGAGCAGQGARAW